LALLVAPLGVRLAEIVRTQTDGPSLNLALAGTGTLLGAFSLLVSAGLLFSS
jgi:1,4-dihydroxy-2-naphthoate octaprenyltransferase